MSSGSHDGIHGTIIVYLPIHETYTNQPFMGPRGLELLRRCGRQGHGKGIQPRPEDVVGTLTFGNGKTWVFWGKIYRMPEIFTDIYGRKNVQRTMDYSGITSRIDIVCRQ